METQLLDVVLSINSYDKTDAGIPYTISEIYKLDIDSKDIDKFKEMIFNSHGVLNVDKLVANDKMCEDITKRAKKWKTKDSDTKPAWKT